MMTLVMANEEVKAQRENHPCPRVRMNCSFGMQSHVWNTPWFKFFGTRHQRRWKSCWWPWAVVFLLCDCIGESGCLRVQPKRVGKFQLKLNIDKRPIANKYREGKMKRTLKRELKVLEIVNRETFEMWGNSMVNSGSQGDKPRGLL